MSYPTVSAYKKDPVLAAILNSQNKTNNIAPPVDPRTLSDQFLDRKDFVGNMYNADGFRVANAVNYTKPYAHAHTQSKGATMEMPETKPDITVIKPLETLKQFDSVYVVSRDNKFKSTLTVESVDLETQTCVISGNFAKEFIQGDSNARVMFDSGNGQLIDIGFVLSIADFDLHEPSPGFEKPNRIRVGTQRTPENIEKIFTDDLFIRLNTRELHSTCSKGFRKKHLAEICFFGSSDQHHFAGPQPFHAEHVATTLFNDEKGWEERNYFPIPNWKVSHRDKNFYYLKEGVYVENKDGARKTGEIPRYQAFIKHNQLTVLLANRETPADGVIPNSLGGNPNITNIQAAWNNWGKIDSVEFAHFTKEGGEIREFNGEDWYLPDYTGRCSHEVSFDCEGFVFHYKNFI